MEENKSTQEKDLPRIMNHMHRFAEERDQFITEIINVLDKIKQNRPLLANKPEQPPRTDAKTPLSDTFIEDLDSQVKDMGMANGRLATIFARLNELI